MVFFLLLLQLDIDAFWFFSFLEKFLFAWLLAHLIFNRIKILNYWQVMEDLLRFIRLVK